MKTGTRRGSRTRAWSRALTMELTVLALAVATVIVALRVIGMTQGGMLGIDFDTYRAFAQRFVDTGSMYLPYQLSGSFDPTPEPQVANAMPSMYPPAAFYLFAPFLVVPAVFWWAIPLGLFAYAMWRWRPAWYAWLIAAVVAMHEWTAATFVAGNTSMWVVAFVAGGLLWGWPAALVILKPSLVPFAFIGSRQRSWWLCAAGIAAASAPLLDEWVAYATVVRHAEASVSYSFGSVPAVLVPVVAWLARALESPRADSGRPRDHSLAAPKLPCRRTPGRR